MSTARVNHNCVGGSCQHVARVQAMVYRWFEVMRTRGVSPLRSDERIIEQRTPPVLILSKAAKEAMTAEREATRAAVNKYHEWRREKDGTSGAGGISDIDGTGSWGPCLRRYEDRGDEP